MLEFHTEVLDRDRSLRVITNIWALLKATKLYYNNKWASWGEDKKNKSFQMGSETVQ